MYRARDQRVTFIFESKSIGYIFIVQFNLDPQIQKILFADLMDAVRIDPKIQEKVI